MSKVVRMIHVTVYWAKVALQKPEAGKRILCAILALGLSIMLVCKFSVTPRTENLKITPVSYESIRVADGDNLWAIAGRIQAEGGAPEDKREIINTIVSSNKMTSGRVYAGEYIWVPVYAE